MANVNASLCRSQVHVQNATLAGGVAIGTASNMSIAPWGALLIGCCAGGLSTVGYAYLTVSELKDPKKSHNSCKIKDYTHFSFFVQFLERCFPHKRYII